MLLGYVAAGKLPDHSQQSAGILRRPNENGFLEVSSGAYWHIVQHIFCLDLPFSGFCAARLSTWSVERNSTKTSTPPLKLVATMLPWQRLSS